MLAQEENVLLQTLLTDQVLGSTTVRAIAGDVAGPRMLTSGPGLSITGGHGGLRRSLIVVQFVISLFLIISTVVISLQMSYIRHKDLGFDRDHVLVLSIDYQVLSRYAALKTAVSRLPGTVSVSGSYNLPVSADWGDDLTANNGHEEVRFTITAIPADLDFTFGGDDVQLPQAFIQIEPGINGRQ